MSSETLGGTKPSIVIADRASEALKKKFVNAHSAALVEGNSVYLHTDGTVKLCVDGSTKAIGIVLKGGAVGANVVVLLYAIAIVSAVIDAASSAGIELEPLGTILSSKPIFSAADAGDYVHAILLEATADVNLTARIAIVPLYQKNA